MDCLPVRPLIKYNTGDGAWMIAQKADQRRQFKAIICTLKSVDENSQSRNTQKHNAHIKLDHPDQFNKEIILENSKTDDPEKIAVINVNFQNLESSDEEFYEFSSVYKIDAANNHLNLENFLSFVSLMELNLSSNDLCDININPQDFENLQILDVSFNHLSGEDILMLGLIKKLRILNLSGNNLKALPTDMDQMYIDADGKSIARFLNLEELNLEYNHLNSNSSFSILAGLKKLKCLKLAHNCFESIPLLKCVKIEPKKENNLSNSKEFIFDDEAEDEEFLTSFYKNVSMGIRIPSTLHEVEENSTNRTNKESLDVNNHKISEDEFEDHIENLEGKNEKKVQFEQDEEIFTESKVGRTNDNQSPEKDDGSLTNNDFEFLSKKKDETYKLTEEEITNPSTEKDQLDKEDLSKKVLFKNNEEVEHELVTAGHDEMVLERINMDETSDYVKDPITFENENHNNTLIKDEKVNNEILEEHFPVAEESTIQIMEESSIVDETEENLENLNIDKTIDAEIVNSENNIVTYDIKDENSFDNNFEDKPESKDTDLEDVFEENIEFSVSNDRIIIEETLNIDKEIKENSFQDEQIKDSVDRDKMENIQVVILKQTSPVKEDKNEDIVIKNENNSDSIENQENENISNMNKYDAVDQPNKNDIIEIECLTQIDNNYDESLWEKNFKYSEKSSYSMMIVDDLLKNVTVSDIIRQISANSFDQSLPKPFSALENLDLSFNKIKSERSLIPVISWLNMKKLSIHNNPVSTNKTQKSSFIKSLLENTFQITVEWLPPLEKEKPHTTITKSKMKVIDTISSLPTKCSKSYIFLTEQIMDDENKLSLPKTIPLPSIVNHSKQLLMEKNMGNEKVIELESDPSFIEFDSEDYDDQNTKFYGKNKSLVWRALQHRLEHPITYFERNVNLFLKAKQLPPKKDRKDSNLTKTDDRNKQKIVEVTLHEQHIRNYESEISLDKVLSSEYFHGDRKKKKQSEIATKALKNMQKKYNQVRLESLKKE